MIVNNKEYNIDELIKEQKTDFLVRRENGLMLSDNDIEILKRYDIDYMKYNNIKSLLFEIEEILDDEEIEELEELSNKLAEISYYNYTNK